MFSPTSNPRTPPKDKLSAVRRTVDMVVAFATLEAATSLRELMPRRQPWPPSSTSPPDPLDAPVPHPHRHPPRRSARRGRPGAVPARAQDCITPGRGRPRRPRGAHLRALTGLGGPQPLDDGPRVGRPVVVIRSPNAKRAAQWRLVASDKPAASYSPGPLRAKYHRR